MLEKLLGRSPETIRDALANVGVTDEEIAAAEEADALPLLVIERLVSDGGEMYSQEEVAAEAGLDVDELSRLWRSLGFPDPRPGAKVFTKEDAGVAALVARLAEEDKADADLQMQMSRVLGQAMSRVAAAQVSTIVEGADSGVTPLAPDEPVGERAGELLEVMPSVLEYVWRRHLEAEARRRLVQRLGSSGDATTAVVGFADLVGFTAVSQQIDDVDLAELVDTFETLAYDVVAGHGGRVVKMIGDEAMFTVDDPMEGAHIALDLADAFRQAEHLSDVRVGLARGPVLEREGDLYGPIVNLAHRVANTAYPGAVVVSEEMKDALVDHDLQFTLKPIPTQTLREIGRVKLWVLRPSDEQESVTARARHRRAAGQAWLEERHG